MPALLDKMHPLLYPPVQSATEGLASIWWYAPPLCLAALLYGLWRRQTATPPREETAMVDTQLQEALRRLEQLTPPSPEQQAGPWLQELNLLLKRFCAVRYPDIASHRFSGRDWLAFLDTRCPAAGLTHWMILIHGSYQPDCRLSTADSAGLYLAVKHWMTAHV